MGMKFVEGSDYFVIYEDKGRGDAHDPGQRVKISFPQGITDEELMDLHREINGLMGCVCFSSMGYETLELSAKHSVWRPDFRDTAVNIRPANPGSKISLVHLWGRNFGNTDSCAISEKNARILLQKRGFYNISYLAEE